MSDTFVSGVIAWDDPGVQDGVFTSVDFVFTVAGTYDFREASFAGDLDLANTSGGAVAVLLPLSTAYTNTGPDITVNLNLAVTVAAPNLAAGSRVQLYNMTQDAELENVEIAAPGYTYDSVLEAGTSLESGDVVRLRATYASGTAYKYNYEQSGTLTPLGLTFGAAQVDWEDANTLNLDGQILTQFSALYPNVQVDAEADGNLFQMAKLIAWLLHFQTTADGIRYYFGALSSLNAGNWQVNTATLDMSLDNTNVATAVQDDAVLLARDDGAYPQVVPTTGGGGLGIVRVAQVVAQGTEADVNVVSVAGLPVAGVDDFKADVTNLDVAVSTRLADADARLDTLDAAISSRLAAADYVQAPDAAANATAVRAELATELARLDAAVSTRLADADYTALDAAGVWAHDLSGAAAAGSAADVVKTGRQAAQNAFAVSV